MNYILIALASFVGFILIKNFGKSKLQSNDGEKNIDVPDIVKVLANKFAVSIDNIISKYQLDVSISQVLAVLQTESGDKYNIDNKYILGDSGKSIGRMQIYFYNGKESYALNDIASKLGYNFVKEDMYDETDNLTAGAMYLHLALQSALNQGSANPIKLSFKKYNGGLDETDLSLNSSASNYADKTFNNYKNFEKYFSLI